MFQEEKNATQRWLLPFTSGVDLSAIEAALHLAENGGATLVAVSFVITPDAQRSCAVRLELIQQSKDFLEACHTIALRLSIPIECYEVYTHDVVGSIATQIHDLECESLVLASRGQETLLLHETEAQQLLLKPPVALLVLRFSSRTTPASQPERRMPLLAWMHHTGSVQRNGRRQSALAGEEELEQRSGSFSEPSSLVLVRKRLAGKAIAYQRPQEG